MVNKLPKPLVLMVLDGFGVGPDFKGNAISRAKTPFYDHLLESYPNTTLEASGEAVGIPEGMAGNSEVGHMNLGAGYVVLQDIMRINNSIKTKKFFTNKALGQLARHIKKHDGALHIVGLLSKAVVHSSFDHLLASIDYAKKKEIKRTYIHVFTDGRDSSPTAGKAFMEELQAYLREVKYGRVASIIGRYYGMDRDLRWDRTKKAYDLLTLSEGKHADKPVKALLDAYDQGQTDEFIEPITITDERGKLVRVIDGDGVLFFNYRTDRPRQLVRACTDDAFDGFERQRVVKDLHFTTMTRYADDIKVSGVCFDPPNVERPFGAVISDYGLRQVRIAESEKQAHVTYFFNGGKELPFPNEDRIIIDSPKVATYDLRPEMSMNMTSEYLTSCARSKVYNFILINFANPDMVGHTGNLQATIEALEVLDEELATIIPYILSLGGGVIVTADHGNAEKMINPETGGMDTEHNIYPVPFIYIAKGETFRILEKGKLADVAPTMLGILGIDVPKEMTGRNLLA